MQVAFGRDLVHRFFYITNHPKYIIKLSYSRVLFNLPNWMIASVKSQRDTCFA